MGMRTLALLAGLAIAGLAEAAPPGARTAARHGATGRYFTQGQLFPTPRLNQRSGSSRGRPSGSATTSPTAGLRSVAPIAANPYGTSRSRYATPLSGSRFYSGN